jgi:zinc D-Ala-D-Ala carboxypeptidase
MPKLSPHFTLEELLESQTARRKGITAQFNPPEKIIHNLTALCENILEPLRTALKKPIKISSGYRCPELNKAVGGAPKSQHLDGQAADIQGAGYPNKKLFEQIQASDLPFDQLIWEYGTKQEPAWVHVSFGPKNRRQILYIGV